MNNPVRAYERSEWRSAGYRLQLCLIVWKTGFTTFRVFQTPMAGGCPPPRTSCLRHSYGVTIFRGIKPLNPCSARFFTHAWDFFIRHKDIYFSGLIFCFLCSYVLINYPYVYTGGRYKIASLPLAIKNIEINFMFLVRLVVSLYHKSKNYGKV